MKFLASKVFWLYFCVTLVFLTLFFGWELGHFKDFLPTLPRPEPEQKEILFASVLNLLLSFNAGLFGYQKKKGTCPVGAKRATGIAGTMGAVALLCPACLLIPLTLFGASISLYFLSPFIPLLQIIALILVVFSTKMMWPKQ